MTRPFESRVAARKIIDERPSELMSRGEYLKSEGSNFCMLHTMQS